MEFTQVIFLRARTLDIVIQSLLIIVIAAHFAHAGTAGYAQGGNVPKFQATARQNTVLRNTTLEDIISAVNAEKLTSTQRQALLSAAAYTIEGLNPHNFIRNRFLNVNPVTNLRTFATYANSVTNFQFHRTLIYIFNLMNDVHTAYTAPPLLRNSKASLGFIVDRYYPRVMTGEKRQAIYIYSPRTAELPLEHPLLKVGAQIISIDNVPVEEMVKILGIQSRAASEASQLIFGISLLTLRSLGSHPVPKRPNAKIRFVAPGANKISETYVPWRYYTEEINELNGEARNELSQSTGKVRFNGEEDEGKVEEREQRGVKGVVGFDWMKSSQLDHSKIPEQIIDRSLLRFSIEQELRSARQFALDVIPVPGFLQDVYFAAILRGARADKTDVGYLHVRSFEAPLNLEHYSFLMQVLKSMPKTGLIVDIRDNLGGRSLIALLLYYFISPGMLDSSPMVLRASSLALKLVKEQLRNGLRGGREFLPAMEDAVKYGEPFTGPVGNYNSFISFESIGGMRLVPRVYLGPVVTLTNALTASASEVYAGLQRDYNASYVIGTEDSTTGAGASVVNYRELQSGAPNALPWNLPEGTDFSTAIIRNYRSRRNSGALIENRGVSPNERHYRTRDDLFRGDVDLLRLAISKL